MDNRREASSRLAHRLRGIAREIVVVNRDRKRAKAVVTDLQYGAALSSVVQIHDGEYSDLTGAALLTTMRPSCHAKQQPNM
jgi:malate/lactate dehydrogenase